MALPEDPVVREVEVFLADALMDKLALLQFPLRPAQAEKLSELEKLTARTKPRNRVLELVLPTSTAEEHFDVNAPSNIRTSRQVLHGAAAAPSTTYAVGVFRDGALHLTPLRETLQLRPSLAHVSDAPLDGDSDSDAEPSDDEAEGAREAKASAPALQEVTYKKKESDREVAQQRRSFAHHRQQIESEAWVPLEVVAAGTEASDDAFHLLYCPEEHVGGGGELEAAAAQKYLGSLQYMDVGAQVNPQQAGKPEGLGIGLDAALREARKTLGLEVGPSGDDLDVVVQPAAVDELSYKTLATYADLEAQVLGILRVAGVVTFDDVARILEKTHAGSEDAAGVALALKQYGLLVRGRWVLRSELVDWRPFLGAAESADRRLGIVDGDEGEDATGSLLACRELALLGVHHHGSVNKLALMATTGLNFRQVDAVLRPWARVNREDGNWVLKIDEASSTGSSLSFGMQDFPDVVHVMNAYLGDLSDTYRSELDALVHHTNVGLGAAGNTDAPRPA